MAKKRKSGGETPAIVMLNAHGVDYEPLSYSYVAHGGASHSAETLGLAPETVVKTLIMQDETTAPLVVLMHGDRHVATKKLASQIGAKTVTPCKPEVAQKHSGYLVGGTSPFGLRKKMPIYVEASILDLPRIAINGGKRGLLVSLSPSVLTDVLDAQPVSCAG